MKRSRYIVAAIGLLYVATAGPCSSAAEPSVKIGDRIEKLRFKDIRYLPRTLTDFGKKKAYVIVCTNTTCPLVKRYLPKLKRLEKLYRDRGVQFVALNVSSDDSISDTAAYGVKYDIEFPCVQDIGGGCVRRLGVKRTPEVAVLGPKYELRYRGRIDDQYRLGGTRPQATQDNLQDAIEAVLHGREVPVKETPVDGCAITLPVSLQPKKPVTFTEHIEPLVRKHCRECHRPGTEAPFSLVTYDDVKRQGRMIAEVVAERRMPPWYASADHGTFINRRGMDSRERELVLQWVRGGLLRGMLPKNSKSPAIQSPAGRWSIGRPDLVVSMTAAHQLPAEGYIPYKYVILPYVFPEETWVQAIEFLPDNPDVLHHCNMGAIPIGSDWQKSLFLSGKVPGSGPLVLEKGTAVRIPKGSVLGLQIHYTTTGKEEACKISVGFRFPRGIVRKQYRQLIMNNRKFQIPPGAIHHKVTAENTLARNAVGIGLFAHMHLRGKDMTFLAHYPGGRTETLLLIPNYSFDWQMGYMWQPGKREFPKGTRIECIAHFDNSPFNPYNPDSNAAVRDGPQTYHEMMYGFLFYTDASENLNLRIDSKTGKVLQRREPKP